ncbi:TPA: hypothetical protein N8237_005410 [Escherichia coli]|uniref:Uncharacterized protein n=1 Tax=Escherichia coli TaxID=562 RepID=A0AAN1ITF5_ECOLX|nr:hypothetical protein [Escherichia coli]AUK04288.1 hypothetical protein CR538_29075 [Escherichia coli]EHI1003556.1 hypothetical protein [Escherichia coli]HCO5619734.1 hypothetical protein [Escherichia coli]HCO7948764.1 hypothetical protein [Escherichia coli]
MSLLPEYEDAEVSTKSLYEISLKHQIEKLLFFREKFVTSLNRPRYTNYVEPDCEYFFDSVINNSAALAEYYLPYIIYSIIGTTLTPPQRPWFSKFKNKCGEDGYQKAKSALFSKYEIGILIKSTSIDNEIYLKKCHDLFDKSIETIIEGKYDIIFTLNNYIKHNSMTFCYAPLSNTSDDKCKSNLFLSFTKDQCFMLEDSILNTLISSDLNETNNTGEIIDINGMKFTNKGSIGAAKLLENNNIIYIKCNEFTGIMAENLLELIDDMIRTIVNNVISNAKGQTTTSETYKKYLDIIETRQTA